MPCNKKVTFGDITIAEYPIELGDNPACSHGAPLTLGWEPLRIHTKNLMLYESLRGGNRRRGKSLRIPILMRTSVLLNSGYTMEELNAATEQVTVSQKQRADTLKNNPGGWGRLLRIIVGPVQTRAQSASSA